VTDGAGGGSRWTKPVVITVAVVVAVYVLFTWVFPWITELGLSPAID
jgi:hypothetical protein